MPNIIFEAISVNRIQLFYSSCSLMIFFIIIFFNTILNIWLLLIIILIKIIAILMIRSIIILLLCIIRIKRWFCPIRSDSNSWISIWRFYFINFFASVIALSLINFIFWLLTLIFLLYIVVFILIVSCNTSGIGFTYVILIATHVITLITIFIVLTWLIVSVFILILC